MCPRTTRRRFCLKIVGPDSKHPVLIILQEYRIVENAPRYGIEVDGRPSLTRGSFTHPPALSTYCPWPHYNPRSRGKSSTLRSVNREVLIGHHEHLGVVIQGILNVRLQRSIGFKSDSFHGSLTSSCPSIMFYYP